MKKMHQKSASSSSSKTQANKSSEKVNKVFRIVITITLLFFVSSITYSLTTYFVGIFNLFSTDWGIMIVRLLDAIAFTYHALNFFITYFSNKIFQREVKSLFNRKKTNIVESRLTNLT